jgi:hypothetical protein
MKVKPHYLVAQIIAAVAPIFLLVHIVRIARRNAQYHAILKTYSDALKPGMKRSDVENYFIMSRYVSFNRGPSEDIVEIAHERAGWICQEQLVYLRFEFAAVEPEKKLVAESGNSLVRIFPKSFTLSRCSLTNLQTNWHGDSVGVETSSFQSKPLEERHCCSQQFTALCDTFETCTFIPRTCLVIGAEIARLTETG